MSTTDAPILVRREGAIATVVLNRPDKLNAMTLDMWLRLGEAMRGLDADDSVRCIVLRGAGDKAFDAGADIAEFSATRANAKQAKEYGRRIAEGAPLVARWHKKFARRLADPCPLSGEEYDESYACFDTEDLREGSAAFVAKRKPVFKGR